MRIALFGPPGAGKGTQSLLLKERFGLDIISTGNLIRTAIREGSEMGKKVEACVNAGQLASDEMVRDLANRSMAEHGFDLFILDGYPRTTTQARWLIEFLDAYKSPMEAVVSLQVSDEVIIDRLSKRRINKVTGESYHLEYHPPPADLDPTLIVQRKDDTPESILARLETYRRDTHPVEEFFRQAGLLFEIDGAGEVSAIFKRILGSVHHMADLQVA